MNTDTKNTHHYKTNTIIGSLSKPHTKLNTQNDCNITDINNIHFDSEQKDECIDYIEDVFFWG